MSAWVPPHTIGGFGGNTFEIFEGKNGKFVKTITVHANPVNLLGIAVTWTDGTSSPQIGRAQGTLKSITFSEGETITKVSLWLSRNFNRTGGISLLTSKGQDLTHGGSPDGRTIFNTDIGSGYLGGFSGRHGDQIDSLAFIFLRPISNVEITKVQYPNLPANSTIIPTTISQTTRENIFSTDIEWNASNTVVRTDTTVWDSLAFNRFGGIVRVRAGIPGIVSGKDQFHWEVGAEISWKQSTSSPNQHGWEIRGTLKPGQKILATSIIQVGDANVRFSSLVVIRLNTNAVLSYQESAILRITQHKYPKGTWVDITSRTDFHSAEPFLNDDGKVPIEPEKDPARKDGDGKLVATKDLEA